MEHKNEQTNVSVVLPSGSKNDDFGRLSRFPENICFGVIFRKIIGFIWRSKDHLEDEGPIWAHLEDQGSFGDEGTFQEC